MQNTCSKGAICAEKRESMGKITIVAILNYTAIMSICIGANIARKKV